MDCNNCKYAYIDRNSYACNDEMTDYDAEDEDDGSECPDFEQKEGIEMQKQQERIKNLLELIQKNPELPIVPMVDVEVVCSDDYGSWMGSWGEGKIDHYWPDDERIYFKENDFEDLVEKVIDTNNNYKCDWNGLSDAQIENKAIQIVDDYDWIKCIIVRIDLPQ